MTEVPFRIKNNYRTDVTSGTSPIVTSSTTQNSNLNSSLLEGHNGNYYLDASNINAGTLSSNRLPALTKSLADLSTSGILVNTGSAVISRSLLGTSNQITVSNSDGISANPLLSISDNPILNGTGSVTIPYGTDAQRPLSPVSGMLRLNTTSNLLEVYANGKWNYLVSSNALTDGSPGYLDSNGVLRSIKERELVFLNKTAGSKNMYLSIVGDIQSNAMGYIMYSNVVVIGMVAQCSANVTTPVTFELRSNPLGTVLTSITIQTGNKFIANTNTNVSIPINTEISCYLSSSGNVPNPICFVNLAKQN